MTKEHKHFQSMINTYGMKWAHDMKRTYETLISEEKTGYRANGKKVSSTMPYMLPHWELGLQYLNETIAMVQPS